MTPAFDFLPLSPIQFIIMDFRKIAGLSSLALMLPSSIAVGLFAGYWLDNWLKTKPWMLMIFTLLGVASGLISLIREVTELYLARAQNKGVKLQAVMPKSDLLVDADSARLSNALGQLVDNAIKFTDAGGRVVIGAHGPIRFPGGGQQPYAVLGVADSGIGIPVERQKALFKAFTQADMSDRRRFEGIGLGLALANRILKAHSGHITLKSEAGRGSTFALWIPMGTAG